MRPSKIACYVFHVSDINMIVISSHLYDVKNKMNRHFLHYKDAKNDMSGNAKDVYKQRLDKVTVVFLCPQ